MSMLVSLELKTDKAIIVEGQATKGKILINKVAAAQLPKGVVADSKIREPQTVQDIVGRLFKESNIKTKNVAVTLDIGNILIRDFDVPNGKIDETMSMVKTEMIQNYSAVVSDVIQYKKLGDIEENGLKKQKIRASAISMEIVQGYYNILKELKLKPLFMDINSNAIEKLIESTEMINGKSKLDEPFMLLEFSHTGTVLHAVSEGIVQISRFTSLGMDDMNEYISSKINQFGEHGEYLDQIDFMAEEESEIDTLAKTFMTQWCNEIQKVIKFILLRLDSKEIKNIYMVGEGVKIKGIEKAISDRIYSNVEPLISLSNLNFKNENDKSTLYQNINAIGALIRL